MLTIIRITENWKDQESSPKRRKTELKVGEFTERRKQTNRHGWGQVKGVRCKGGQLLEFTILCSNSV